MKADCLHNLLVGPDLNRVIIRFRLACVTLILESGFFNISDSYFFRIIYAPGSM